MLQFWMFSAIIGVGILSLFHVLTRVWEYLPYNRGVWVEVALSYVLSPIIGATFILVTGLIIELC